MFDNQAIATSRSRLTEEQYGHSKLLEEIQAGIRSLGLSIDNVQLDDLGSVDEFHIGGRAATASFLDQLDIDRNHRVLDVGCGIGGGSRFAVDRYGCHVTGVDLTADYIETGNALSAWLDLTDQVSLEYGDVTDLSAYRNSFDVAYMLHVGMNISEKQVLGQEVFQALRPGATFGIYDVMRVGEGELQFPVPWASNPTASFVSSPQEYKEALETAGFRVIAERSRHEFAIDFFARLKFDSKNDEEPPPLGLHILMGDTANIKIQNMIQNLSEGIIAPVEIIAKKI